MRVWAAWLGPRSALMVALGVLWVVLGYGIWHGLGQGLDAAPHSELTPGEHALIWAIPGALAIPAALTHRGKSIALGLLNLAPLVRATSYLVSWLAAVSPWHDGGEPTGYYYAALHGAIALGVLAVALIHPTPAEQCTHGGGRR